MAQHGPTHHGNHGVTFNFEPIKQIESPRAIARATQEKVLSSGVVTDAEQAAITARREYIKDLPPPVVPTERPPRRRDRTDSPRTALALSGGGIRSASFSLGVLQALDVTVGIEGIDYLSTVSGGGYVGCSLTAALQHTQGESPFTDAKTRADTASVAHIRDYSNYLIPHGTPDVITAAGIIVRGLVANAMIVLPLILFLVWVTLVAHPTVESLNQAKFLIWDLANGLNQPEVSVSNPLWGLNGFWFTLMFLAFDLLFLVIWTMAKSLSASQFCQHNIGNNHAKTVGDSAELYGPLPWIWKVLFFLTILCAFCEAQPFILFYTTGQPSVKNSCSLSFGAAGQCFSAIANAWILQITPVLAPLGALIAFFSKHLSDVAGTAQLSPGLMSWIKKLMAKGVIWLGAVIIPSLLWLLYLKLTSIGLHSAPLNCPWVPNVAARDFLIAAAALSALAALAVNPNVTSLYRLYRDRLCKAFLFDPENRDARGDLKAVEPKLHTLNTNYCPYPIINAALNIEGSQFANKRGRNADFFMFTPEYTGSDATGYIGTERIEKDETALNVGTAMAISAAAVSSNMGRETIKPLSLTLALLNIRLGYWLRNPLYIRQDRSYLSRLVDIRSFLLYKEMFNLITETSGTVYLTDGGNIENLGVYTLMKRRCPLIIAVDAEADPTMSFSSLLTLERYARIDLGATIDLPWEAIRDRTLEVDEAFCSADAAAPPLAAAGVHCAAGEISYGPGETGIIFYVKASLTGDENDYVLGYKRRNPDFPHETTSDQFFDEEQLEVYRALGFHIVERVLHRAAPFAVRPRREETEEQARNRILDAMFAALGVAAEASRGH